MPIVLDFMHHMYVLCNFALQLVKPGNAFCIAFLGFRVFYGLWRFLDYHCGGNNLIEEWYLDQPEEAQAEFDVTLKTLSITEDCEDCLSSIVRARWIMRNPIQGRKNPVSSSRILRTWGEVLSIYVGCSKKGRIYTRPMLSIWL